MGYSLPASDLTMAQFLKTSAESSRIPFEIVDVVPKQKHFQNILGNDLYDLKQAESHLDCIPAFVVANCVPNQKDRDHVIRTTLWKTRSNNEIPPNETKIAEETS